MHIYTTANRDITRGGHGCMSFHHRRLIFETTRWCSLGFHILPVDPAGDLFPRSSILSPITKFLVTPLTANYTVHYVHFNIAVKSYSESNSTA